MKPNVKVAPTVREFMDDWKNKIAETQPIECTHEKIPYLMGADTASDSDITVKMVYTNGD